MGTTIKHTTDKMVARTAPARRAAVSALVTALAVVLLAPCAQGAVGDMDPSYGVNGRFEAGRYGGSQVLALLNDGRVLYEVEGGYSRTDVNGLPDPAFAAGGVQAWPAGYLPLRSFLGRWQRSGDGKWTAVLMGQDDGGSVFEALRVGQDGALDSTFGVDGVAAVELAPDGTRDAYFAVRPDGKILLLLARNTPDNYYYYDRLDLVRMRQDGTPDPTFGALGHVSVSTGLIDLYGTGLGLISGGPTMVLNPETCFDDSGASTDCRAWISGASIWWVGALLPDGGWFAWSQNQVAKVLPTGEFDRRFGDAGDGTQLVTFLEPRTYASVDGNYLYATGMPTGSPKRTQLARYYSGGPPAGLDMDFGIEGLIRFQSSDRQEVLGVADGSTMIAGPGYAYRLLGQPTPSPGFLSVEWPPAYKVSDGKAWLRVARAAGGDGVVRVRYWMPAVSELPAGPNYAKPGADFTPVSGELVWSDLEMIDKTIEIPLTGGGPATGDRELVVRFEVTAGDTWIDKDTMSITVNYDAQTPPASPPPAGGHGGGGGAIGYAVVLMLWAAGLARRRMCARVLPLGMAMAAGVVSTQAVAESGDVDPSFVYPRPAVLEPDSTNAIPLANGFLIIKSHMAASSDVDPHSTLEVERIDEDGHLDTSFGLNGKVVNTLPGRVNLSTAAAVAVDGSYLVGGWRLTGDGVSEYSTAAIARLDSTGHVAPLVESVDGVLGLYTSGQFGSRVAAIAAPDSTGISVLTWSAYAMDLVYGECANNDVVDLVQVPSYYDGDVYLLGTLHRLGSSTNACHTSATLLFDQKAGIFGSETGVFAGNAPSALGRGFGPFAFDAVNGDLILTEVDGDSVGIGKPASTPQQPDPGVWRYVCVACAAGFQAPIAWSPAAFDRASGRMYLGFATDAGQAGVAAFRLNGELDTGWGGDGVVVLINSPSTAIQGAGLANDIRLIDVRPDGALVVVTGAGLITRLEGGAGTAHGAFVLAREKELIAPPNGSVAVQVYRTGGAQGAVSVDFATATCAEVLHTTCTDGAEAGTDFPATSGTLDWADGDMSPKEITVSIPASARFTSTKRFFVVLSNEQGGASNLSKPQVWMMYASAQGGGGGSGGGGGGGSFGATGLLLALLAAGVQRRRVTARAYWL
jgi:hypothetical protein